MNGRNLQRSVLGTRSGSTVAKHALWFRAAGDLEHVSRGVDCAAAACLSPLRFCIKIKSPRQLQATPMTNDPDPDPASDPDKLKGPGGMTLRQIHEQVQKSVQRDREAQGAHDSPAPPQRRWQRWVRYVWGRSGRR